MATSLFNVLNISRQDMLSRLADLDQVANNLANVNTTGFKSSRSNFQELLVDSQKNGVYLSSTQVSARQGTILDSDSPLHLAINGEGFFAIQLPGDQTGYTRDGKFELDDDNQLVTANGYPVVWDGEIPADAEEVEVLQDGRVMARQGETWSEAGQIEITRFPNPTGLASYGENLWLETEVSGEGVSGAPMTENYGQIFGASVEASNVDLSTELTHLMSLQRNFQMSARAFQQTDEMITDAIHVRKA
jgi:flagellar basal-body rod protein FlgG